MAIFKDLDKFFSTNWINISLVVFGLFLVLAVVAIKNIEFKPNRNRRVDKVLLFEKFRNREGLRNRGIVEGLDALDSLEPAGSTEEVPNQGTFCSKTPVDLEKGCRKLHQEQCKVTDCCIWGKPKTSPGFCMAGNQFGPMVDSGKKQLEWWWYKGPKSKKAIRYPKQSEEFKPREGLVQPVAKKHPLESAHAQMLQHEAQKTANAAAQQRAASAAGGTIPKNPAGSPSDPASSGSEGAMKAATAAASGATSSMQAMKTMERENKVKQGQVMQQILTKQKREIDNLKLQHKHQVEQKGLNDKQADLNIKTESDKQTAEAVKTIIAKKRQADKAAQIDALQLKAEQEKNAADQIGDAASLTDKNKQAADQMKIKTEQRKLETAANTYQGKAGGIDISKMKSGMKKQKAMEEKMNKLVTGIDVKKPTGSKLLGGLRSALGGSTKEAFSYLW